MGQLICGCYYAHLFQQPPARVKSPAAPSHDSGTQAKRRTSQRAALTLYGAEMDADGFDRDSPVQLVVFDFDETLTLATFMTETGVYESAEVALASRINFQTPWAEGSRVDKLLGMLRRLARGRDGRRRTLAVLTKNNSVEGVTAVLNLLRVAGLDAPFSAIWMMPSNPMRSNGAYQEGGVWKYFDPPLHRVGNNKVDALVDATQNPVDWFPQLAGAAGAREHPELLSLRPEGVVLVDDQPANFYSSEGRRLARYCKVATYDAVYNFSMCRNMGGIGAHGDADYRAVVAFVDSPSQHRETCKASYLEPGRRGRANSCPSALVVFDFDETLTLATFLPEEAAFSSQIGWMPRDPARAARLLSEFAEYNFESPWVSGCRAAKLRHLFEGLAGGDEANPARTLAVLSEGEHSAIAIVNLLRLAGLASSFAAVWTMTPGSEENPNGVYQASDGEWVPFMAPIGEVHNHKADILQHVARHPMAWFPQLATAAGAEQHKALLTLQPEGIVLVDDERANFASDSGMGLPEVRRCCKVARYDKEYRDCGVLNQMGGLGAHSDEDFDTLSTFVKMPAVRAAASKVPPIKGFAEARMSELVRYSTSETGSPRDSPTPRDSSEWESSSRGSRWDVPLESLQAQSRKVPVKGPVAICMTQHPPQAIVCSGWACPRVTIKTTLV